MPFKQSADVLRVFTNTNMSTKKEKLTPLKMFLQFGLFFFFLVFHFALAKLWHLQSKVVTFRATIAFCVSYYILWHHISYRNQIWAPTNHLSSSLHIRRTSSYQESWRYQLTCELYFYCVSFGRIMFIGGKQLTLRNCNRKLSVMLVRVKIVQFYPSDKIHLIIVLLIVT